MKRIMLAAAAALALLPAAFGLLGNDSFAGSVPARVPAGAQPVTSVDVSPAPAVPLMQPLEVGDDHGGDRVVRTPEPGDDHGGRNPATSSSAGSGSPGSHGPDDAGSGHTGPGSTSGDDHHVDNRGADDHGSDRHGKDDR